MKGKLFQIQAGLASSFGHSAMGSLEVWPSYTSNIFSSNESTPLSEPMSIAEISLLGSLPSLGAMLGSAIIGILMDRLGRRNAGVVMALPFVISWAMISATTSKIVVLVARFLGGMAGGAFLVFAPIFISEVAEDSFRGTVASGPTLLYTSGTFFSYLFGWTLSYRIIIWVNVVFSVTIVLFFLTVKESPVFLLRQKRDEEAGAAIAHYRGVLPSSPLVLVELTKLKQQLMPSVKLISVVSDAEESDLKEEEAEKQKLKTVNIGLEEQKKRSLTEHLYAENADLKVAEAEKEKLNTEDNIEPAKQKKKTSIKLLFESPSSRRAFLVVMTVMTTQVCMGIVPVQVFAKNVFTQADPAKADYYTVIFALVFICGGVVPTLIADKAGRRFLIMTSSALVGLCAGSTAYLIQSGTGPPWVTALVIMMYSFSFMSGAGSVPYLLLAEVFKSEIQNLASIIIVEWIWFLNFATIAIFPYMNTFFGMHGSFYCFAAVAFTNVVICYFIVPETKGLSNEQIQELLVSKKKI